MKKICISADIEGIWGNSNPANTAKNGYLYSEYCTNMMNEVNLVIDLLFQNGVEEVVVNDGHGNMDNLLPSKLDPRAAFVAANGAYKEFGMMEGLDDSFDGAMFIGYHSRCQYDVHRHDDRRGADRRLCRGRRRDHGGAQSPSRCRRWKRTG